MKKVHILNVFLFALTSMLCSCFVFSDVSTNSELDRKYREIVWQKYRSKDHNFTELGIKYDEVVKLQNKVKKELKVLKEINNCYVSLEDSLVNLKKKANEYGIPVNYDMRSGNPSWQGPYSVSSINEAEYQKLSKKKKKKYLDEIYTALSSEYNYYSKMRSSADKEVIGILNAFASIERQIYDKKKSIEEEERRIAERKRIEKEEAMKKRQEEEEWRQMKRKMAAKDEKRRKSLVAKYGERNGNLIAKGKIVLGMSKSMVVDALERKVDYLYDKSVRAINGKRIETWYRTSKYTSMLGGFLGGLAEMSLMKFPQTIEFVNGKVTAIDY